MFEWLNYAFMVRALVATTVLSFSVAPVGAFLVLRRLSLAGEAMAHAMVPGLVRHKHLSELVHGPVLPPPTLKLSEPASK